MLARLSRVVLNVRGAAGLAAAVEFYHAALGLRVLRATDDWAELVSATGPAATSSDPASSSGATNTRLCLQVVSHAEAPLATGYSPLVAFDVEDLQGVVQRCLAAGAHLDGPIQFPAHGAVAALRAPDGHMLGLYEPVRPAAGPVGR